MPEVTYETVMRLPVDTVWRFVEDMNNWAPFLTGYQKHEIKTDTNSQWTLKGDVGILSRTVELDVNITEWVEQERVAFTLVGLNEMVEGGGLFLLGPLADDEAGDEAAAQEAAPEPAEPPQKKKGLWGRFMAWFFRTMFRRKFGTVERKDAPALEDLKASGDEASKLSFTLRMDAGGPTAPLVNAMLEPALMPAAEDLANKIAAHLEAAAEAA